MIAYDLAKQLKGEGFPQKFESAHYYSAEGVVARLTARFPSTSEDISIPTIDELIEACGDDFMALILWPEPRGDLGRWTADTRCGGRARGNTPEEAVARTWLLLNKSQNEQTDNP